LLALFFLTIAGIHARTLEVGTGRTYANPTVASQDALPGDTILIYGGTYTQSYFIENLHGTADAWITIMGKVDDAPDFSGNTEALHFSDCTYLRIERLAINGQTGNGINIDDGGTFDTPSHHISLKDLYFSRIAATGNNDFLKMSGVDSFSISYCFFELGSPGGSGIDMVGCHYGKIFDCNFRSMGSNAIQAKGGTAFIEIARGIFEDCGERALNLGGSTGLQFFRPLDAPYEAANIRVYANLFIRGNAPIAYVGSTRIEVVNNTIIHPVRWVIRILQETVDASRFVPCGDNTFRNNVVVTNGLTGPHVNIGSNTNPESFLFESNLWWDEADTTNTDVELPSVEVRGIRGQNPRLSRTSAYDVRPLVGSPAIGAGTPIPGIGLDLQGFPFANPPSIGAREGATTSGVSDRSILSTLTVAPNPANNYIRIENASGAVSVSDFMGRVCLQVADAHLVDLSDLAPGLYIVRDAHASAVLAVTR